MPDQQDTHNPNEEKLAYEAYLTVLRDPVKRAAPCCLCGGYADMIGIYTPSAAIAKRLGQPAGKRRLIGYKVCTSCMEEPFFTECIKRVEEAILREKGVQ